MELIQNELSRRCLLMVLTVIGIICVTFIIAPALVFITEVLLRIGNKIKKFFKK